MKKLFTLCLTALLVLIPFTYAKAEEKVDEAKEIQLNTVVEGEFTEDKTEAIYKIELKEDLFAVIQLAASSLANWQIYPQGMVNRFVSISDIANQPYSYIPPTLKSGTYYIKVNGRANSDFKFKLQSSKDFEKVGWRTLVDGSRMYQEKKNYAVKRGWAFIDDNWYYFSTSGIMQTGWLPYKDKWYHLNKKGTMDTGWLSLYGQWFYLEKDGTMATDWKFINSQWFHLGQNGIMDKGWIFVDGKWYYLFSDGHMAADTVVDGYPLGKDGAWIK